MRSIPQIHKQFERTFRFFVHYIISRNFYINQKIILFYQEKHTVHYIRADSSYETLRYLFMLSEAVESSVVGLRRRICARSFNRGESSSASDRTTRSRAPSRPSAVQRTKVVVTRLRLFTGTDAISKTFCNLT